MKFTKGMDISKLKFHFNSLISVIGLNCIKCGQLLLCSTALEYLSAFIEIQCETKMKQIKYYFAYGTSVNLYIL